MSFKLAIDARFKESGIGTVVKNLIRKFSHLPIEVKLITNSIPIYSLKEQFYLPFQVPKCDVFWSPHFNVPVFPLRARKRVVTIHDIYHIVYAKNLTFLERMYAKFMYKKACNVSDCIVTDSEFSKSQICKYLQQPEGKVRVIYPGVNSEHFSDQFKCKSVKFKYSLPDEFILFVGNIKVHKNLSLLFRTYRKFNIPLPLVVVGKIQGLRNSDFNFAQNLTKNILFFESVTDEELPSFYQLANALIFPSKYEGFGLPPLEAMSAGCPVIASHAASIPEVCQNSAFYINPDDPEELYRAILHIYHERNFRAELIAKGRKNAERFNWESTANQYYKLFKELVYDRKV